MGGYSCMYCFGKWNIWGFLFFKGFRR